MADRSCAFFWRHICVASNSRVTPCCRFQFDQLTEEPVTSAASIVNSFNSTAFQNMRGISSANEFVSGCQKCKLEEESGALSLRQIANSTHRTPDFTKAKPELVDIDSLELFLGRTCNLKCLTCSPRSSTAWQADYAQLNWPTHKFESRSENYSELIKSLPMLREIKLVGGEPLLERHHLSLLESIPSKQAASIRLKYFSNATVFADKRLLTQWQRFAGVSLWLSIDGFGEVNEFVRFPSKWIETSANVEEYFRLADIESWFHVGIHTTVSAYNVFSLEKLSKWYHEDLLKGASKMDKFWRLNFLSDPAHLAVEILPPPLWEQACDIVSRLPEENAKLSRIESERREELFAHFLNYSVALDRIRGTKLSATIPEFAPFLSANEK